MSEQAALHQQHPADSNTANNRVNNSHANNTNNNNNSNFPRRADQQPTLGRVREKMVVEQGLVPKKMFVIHCSKSNRGKCTNCFDFNSKRITFGIHSAEDMRKMSHFQVGHHEMYQMPSKKPVPYGVLDPRLGTSQKSLDCETCGLPLKDCVGHFAYVKFDLPIFHIGYFKATIDMLQRICKVFYSNFCIVGCSFFLYSLAVEF